MDVASSNLAWVAPGSSEAQHPQEGPGTRDYYGALSTALWIRRRQVVSREHTLDGMDAVDEALKASQQVRLAEASRLWKARHTRRCEDAKVRRRRRLYGLRSRHAAKLARIPKPRLET